MVFLLSFRLKPDEARPEVQIDFVGVVLAAAAIILISFGFNNLNRWGLGLATPNAPFDLFGLSPAPIMIVVGIVLGQAFLMWTHRRQAAGKTPLLALEVIDFAAGAGGGLRDVCRGRAGGDAEFLGAALHPDRAGPLAARDSDRHDAVQPDGVLHGDADRADSMAGSRRGRSAAMASSSALSALVWLAFVVRNDWSAVPVLLGLVLFGIGQGSLVTLLFNVLVTASPKELAGDVGSLRGTTKISPRPSERRWPGALLVGLLSAIVLRQHRRESEIAA